MFSFYTIILYDFFKISSGISENHPIKAKTDKYIKFSNLIIQNQYSYSINKKNIYFDLKFYYC